MRFGWLLPLALVLPSRASAQQAVFGYQLGLTQSAGTTIGDVQVAIAEPGGAQPIDDQQAVVSQAQGLQLTTTVNGNITLDITTRTLNHAFVLGVGAAQLVPTLLPRDENGQLEEGVIAERTTTFQLNANYLAVMQRPRWSGALSAGYGFGLNGILSNAADGGLQGAQLANAQNNVPGQQVGAFSFNGQTHTVNTQFVLQLTPSLNWDLSFNAAYGYTRNGVFTLAAGPLGGQNQAGALATNLGAFVPATIHTVSPSLLFRRRVGRSGQLDMNALVTYTLAEEVDDRVTVTGTTTQIFRAVQPPPPTLLNQVTLQYAYNMNDNRAFGGQVVGDMNFRVPTDQQGIVLANEPLAADTLIYLLRAFYTDLWPWELRATIGIGAAQAWLFQPPLGAQEDLDSFSTVRSNWEPVFDVSLARRFDPVDVTLFATRTVGVGALGVSAIVTESANLVFAWQGEFGDFRPAVGVGFNAQRIRGVGRDLFQLADPNQAAVLAFNNQGFGTNVTVAIPIFEYGGLSFDLQANYNFNYLDPDPDNELNLDPLATHTVFAALRAIYGRGPAQTAAAAGGRTMRDELDAFTADPLNGSPLLSNQLMQSGDPLQLGRRIGQRPEPRRDSRQAYQQQIQHQAREQAERERSGVVQSVGTAQEEARRAAEEAEKRREEEKKAPKLPVWPDAPPAEEPPPPEPPE